MRAHKHVTRHAVLIVMITMSLLASGCTSGTANTPTPLPPNPPIKTATPAVTPVPVTATGTPVPATTTATLMPIPEITLNPGAFYFSIDGQPSFILSRNLAGYETSQYDQLLDLTSLGGSKFVRVQLDSLGMGYSNTGEVDEAWAKKWEDIFERAASNGIAVVPVFGVWYDWNNGHGYSTWKSNPLK